MDDLPANRLRVLIVEDDRITARDLEETLKRRGFIIAGVAYSAAEVPAIVGSMQPEIALLNIDLDNASSGIALAKELSEQHDIPVIFITGYSEETLYEKAREAKPAGFIRKPFSDAEGFGVINMFRYQGDVKKIFAHSADPLTETVLRYGVD